ncbi:hypothetical protein BGT96224_A20945 [Blumeria graminis f. sp. tritici 96224]|nr:hypothetical protein BGT96224_A20945 [Blumeria graminis f. sp. tritici 96224]
MPPGGPKAAIRRRAAADQRDKVANARPSSTRAAGAGGSSSTMLISLARQLSLFQKHRPISSGFETDCISNQTTGLYTDESPGLKVDPVVVLVLSLVFIFSVVSLHG